MLAAKFAKLPIEDGWQGFIKTISDIKINGADVDLLLDQATRFPRVAVLGLLFKSAAQPFTPTQVEFFATWLKTLSPKKHPGKTILLEELQKLKDRIKDTLEHPGDVDKLQDILDRGQLYGRPSDKLFLIDLKERIKHFENQVVDRSTFHFPIARLMSFVEIDSIPLEAWEAIDTTNPSNILSQMFEKDTLPIAPFECKVYIEVVEESILNPRSKRLIMEALQVRKREMEHYLAGPGKRSTPLEKKIMEIHLDALQAEDDPHFNEPFSSWDLGTDVSPLNDDKDSEESDIDEEVFPIKEFKTLDEIALITEEELEILAHKTEKLDAMSIIYGAMFLRVMAPVTKLECKIYIDLIKKKLSSATHLIEALKIQSKMLDRVAMNMRGTADDVARVENMKRHIRALHAHDEVANPYQEVDDILAAQERRIADEQDVRSTPISRNAPQRPRAARAAVEAKEPPRTARSVVEAKEPPRTARAAVEAKERQRTARAVVEANEPPRAARAVVEAKERPRAARAVVNNRLIGSTLRVVDRLDMSKPLFPFAQLRQLFDDYLQMRQVIQRNRRIPVSKEFLQNVNMRLYEWVRDVMAFLQFTSQSPATDDDDSDTNQSCDSLAIGSQALREAIQLANPEMSLSIEETDDNIPKPKKIYLVQAMLYYANPLRRLTATAYSVMANAMRRRLVYFAIALRDEVLFKDPAKLTVCPTLTSAGRVPHNKLERAHFRANATTMYPHPDNAAYVVVSESGEDDLSPDDDKTIIDDEDSEEEEEDQSRDLVDEERYF